MNDTSRNLRSRQPPFVLVFAVLAVLLVLAVSLQAWEMWRRDQAPLTPPGVKQGALLSVSLVNGQVYYGALGAGSARSLTLEGVYYVQPDIDSAGNTRGNRLVRRQASDWHAPTRMTIAADKILMVEEVGKGSRLQQLVEQDLGRARNTPQP